MINSAAQLLPFATFSFKLYLKSCNRVNFDKLNNLVLLGPLCNNHIFLPSKLDSAFTLWKGKGIVSFCDLFLNGTFVDFESLFHKHDLPRTNFFRYLQVRCFIKDHCSTFPCLLADLPKIFDKPETWIKMI